MDLNIQRIEILLLIAAIVAMVVRRIRLPYTVGLVVAGTALAMLPNFASLSLSRDLVFTVLLPPLIFEAAFQMDWTELRGDLPVTMTLATIGVLIAAAVTAAGLHFLLGWEWQPSVLLGILTSATDPVSVIATFTEANVRGRLRMLVEAESLFNDGTSAVLFSSAIALFTGSRLGGPQVASAFVVTFVGGIACGTLIGWALLRLAGRTEDHLVEITFSTVAAYGSFLAAERFHLSGVMATLSAGILFGNYGSCGAITARGRAEVLSFWEYAAFVASPLVVPLIGLRLTHQHFSTVQIPLLTTLVLVLVGRSAAVYGCCLPFARGRWRVARSHQHILVWGGLRGALALALVFGLPPDLPRREVVTTIVFGVVAFSVLVQGLTVPWLLRRLGALGSPAGPTSAGTVPGDCPAPAAIPTGRKDGPSD